MAHGTATWEESGEGKRAHDHYVPSGRRGLVARTGRMAQQAGGAREHAGAQPLVARMVGGTNSPRDTPCRSARAVQPVHPASDTARAPSARAQHTTGFSRLPGVDGVSVCPMSGATGSTSCTMSLSLSRSVVSTPASENREQCRSRHYSHAWHPGARSQACSGAARREFDTIHITRYVALFLLASICLATDVFHSNVSHDQLHKSCC